MMLHENSEGFPDCLGGGQWFAQGIVDKGLCESDKSFKHLFNQLDETHKLKVKLGDDKREINKPEEALVGAFKKTPLSATTATDPNAALAGLEVTALPPAEDTKSTFIGVEGFEGEYGGIEFSNEEHPYLRHLKALRMPLVENLMHQTGAGIPLENLLVEKKREVTVPEMSIVKEINAEFRESVLVRIGFKGTVFLRTLPPNQSTGTVTEFSFHLEGASRIKRATMMNSCISSLGNGIFHVRTQPKEEFIAILKFSLLPSLIPLPLRMKLIKKHSGTLLSVMIQYASNPELLAPLTNIMFILKLPVDPILLKVSPKAVLNRAEKKGILKAIFASLEKNKVRLNAAENGDILP
ncbi:hypothetical protein HPP92_000781 [Vanilla planifolia]|uniref:Uncharacterized protein n=1 Tax=Vanilla planifolia TaxID=51239 RepID=A0A835VGF3_VANPL|nr:hypothetical protein HPP92_000781 [Vanilla planifolia]